MKYIKQSLYVFIPLLLSLFLVKGYISTNLFKGNLEHILKSTGLNVEFRKVRLKGLSVLEIDNLKVKDQSGNVVIDAGKAKARINLMMPSRLLKIDIYNAVVNLERYKENKFNVFNILKPAKKEKVKTYDKTNRIGKLYFYDSLLNYSDTSFDKRIGKTLKNVKGYLETSLSRGFSLAAEGYGEGEWLKVKLAQQVNTIQSFMSMFDNRSNNALERKEFKLGFEFKDVNVTEELGQYVPLEMISAKAGKLNGTLEISDDNKEKVMKVRGKLDVKGGTVSYVDYEGDIENADAVIDMKKDIITVDAKSVIGENTVTFKMSYEVPSQKISIKLAGKDIPFSEIARYRLIREAGVAAEGNVTADLAININQQQKKTTLDGKFSSPVILLGGYGFRDLKTEMKISEDQMLTLTNTDFHFDESISGFKVKNDVSVPLFTYNIKDKKGEGKYIITNRGSDYSISQVTGSATIDPENVVRGSFSSTEADGNYIVDIKNQKMTVNAEGKGYFTVNYGGQSYEVNPYINALVIKFNEKNVLQAGSIKAKLKSSQNKYFDMVNASININDGNYGVNAIVSTKGQNIKVVGNTTAEMYHTYRITPYNNRGIIDVAKLLRGYGYDFKGLDKARLPLSFTANISGSGDKMSGTYEVFSSFGEYIVEYENLYARGKINDLMNMNLDVDARMSELWVGYQRFKNVSGNLNIKDSIVGIDDITSEKLQAKGFFNLQDGNMKIDSQLKDYVVYNTIKPEVNLYVNEASLNVKGPFSNLSGSILLKPSKTTINSKYIGDTEGNVEISESVLNFKELILRDNKISGTYDMKTGLADAKLTISEADVPKLFDIPELTFGGASELSLKGDLNKFNLSGNINLSNISYKGFRLPSINTDIEYEDGNVDKLFKYGTFNIKNLAFRGDEGEELFKTNTKVDLETVNIDYKLENQKFSLDSVRDLKNKGYSGDIDLNFIFKGRPEDFLTDVKIKSEALVLGGFPVENLDIDVRGTNKGINIGQFYMEYEKNPLLVNGYFNFSDVNYNISVLAKNFNLEFLGVDQNVKEAGGIADIDIVFSPEQTGGKFLLNNFNYKTKDGLTDVDNVNADIGIDSRKLTVNRLDGGYNGGTFTVDGNLDIPSIPADFMKTKRMEFGKFELNTALNSVGVRYGKDIYAVLTGDIVFTEDHLFGNINAESGEIRAIPDFAGKSKEITPEEQEKILKDKTIVDGVIEEVIDKIMKQYVVDINIRASKNVRLNIPAISLVKNIKGSFSGESKILYENGEIGLIGAYTIGQGSFMLNNNVFRIENAEIRFPEVDETGSLKIDPFIVFSASTKIGGERVGVELSGKTDNPDIKFTSDSGLSKEQIVSLLAFNTTTGEADPDRAESQDGAIIIGSVVNTALNQLIFSPVTGKIGETFGLNNVSVSTDFEKSETTGEYSGATTLYIQDNLYKDKWFWNLQVKFPFQMKTETGNNTTNPVGYNAWINYNLREGMEFKVGGETITKKDEVSLKNKNEINYYFGIDFYTRADSFGDLWKKLFRRRKLDTLTK